MQIPERFDKIDFTALTLGHLNHASVTAELLRRFNALRDVVADMELPETKEVVTSGQDHFQVMPDGGIAVRRKANRYAVEKAYTVQAFLDMYRQWLTDGRESGPFTEWVEGRTK